MKVTRRRLAGALLVTAAARAQSAAQAAPPRTPEEELKAARARLQAAGDMLTKQEVPMATEPAFQFKA